MKRLFIIFPIYFMIIYISKSQVSEFKKYIDSFNKEDKINESIILRKIANKGGQLMSKDEASAFVYHGDTSKLYCIQIAIDFGTEKKSDIKKELFLPSKCLKLDMGTHFLIAYTSFECESNKNSLFLGIVDKTYMMTDTLLVYRGDNYNSDIEGLLNPKNGNVFLYGNHKNISKKQAIIYKINPSKLKFEIIKENDDPPGSIDYLNQTLDRLGWKETFIN